MRYLALLTIALCLAPAAPTGAERTKSHPLSPRSSRNNEGWPLRGPLESFGIERLNRRPQRSRVGVYWLTAEKAKWGSVFRISTPTGSRPLSGRSAGTAEEVWLGTPCRQDAPDRVRAVCRTGPGTQRGRQARDVRLSAVHGHQRGNPVRPLHRAR